MQLSAVAMVLPLCCEQGGDDLGEGGFVSAVDEFPEALAAGGIGRFELALGFFEVVKAGVDAERDDAAGDGGADGGVTLAVHQVAEHLADGGFAQAEGVEGAGEDHRAAGAGPDVGQDVAGEHRLHFLGDAGHDVDGALAEPDGHAAGGSAGVVDGGRSLWGAWPGCGWRGPSAGCGSGNISSMVASHAGVQFQRHTHHAGEGLAGEVILGGAEAAGDQQHIAARGILADGQFDHGLIVGDGLMWPGRRSRRRRAAG